MKYLHTAFEQAQYNKVIGKPYIDPQGRIFTLVDAAAESGDRSRVGWLVLHEEREGCQPRNHWGFTVNISGR